MIRKRFMTVAAMEMVAFLHFTHAIKIERRIRNYTLKHCCLIIGSMSSSVLVEIHCAVAMTILGLGSGRGWGGVFLAVGHAGTRLNIED